MPYQQFTNEALLHLWQSGEDEVFDIIYRRHILGLLQEAFYKTGSKDTAHELVHELFFYLFEQRKRLKVKGNFRAYLYTSLKNRVLNYYRHQAVHLKYEKHIHLRPSVIWEEKGNNYENKELAEKLEEEVQKLPEKCKQVFILSRIEQLSHREIAAQLKISTNTVEQHIRKAQHLLKAGLKEFYIIFLIILSQIGKN
jgi:RNA polymerase sigma-70 factor (ECF subfamily)